MLPKSRQSPPQLKVPKLVNNPSLTELATLRAKAEYAVYHTKTGVPQKYIDDLINTAGELDVTIFSMPKTQDLPRQGRGEVVYGSTAPGKDIQMLSKGQTIVKLRQKPDLDEPISIAVHEVCNRGARYSYDEPTNSITIHNSPCTAIGFQATISYRKIGEVASLKTKYGANIPLGDLDDLEALSKASSFWEISCVSEISDQGNPKFKVIQKSINPKDFGSITRPYTNPRTIAALKNHVCEMQSKAPNPPAVKSGAE